MAPVESKPVVSVPASPPATAGTMDDDERDVLTELSATLARAATMSKKYLCQNIRESSKISTGWIVIHIREEHGDIKEIAIMIVTLQDKRIVGHNYKFNPGPDAKDFPFGESVDLSGNPVILREVLITTFMFAQAVFDRVFVVSHAISRVIHLLDKMVDWRLPDGVESYSTLEMWRGLKGTVLGRKLEDALLDFGIPSNPADHGNPGVDAINTAKMLIVGARECFAEVSEKLPVAASPRSVPMFENPAACLVPHGHRYADIVFKPATNSGLKRKGMASEGDDKKAKKSRRTLRPKLDESQDGHGKGHQNQSHGSADTGDRGDGPLEDDASPKENPPFDPEAIWAKMNADLKAQQLIPKKDKTMIQLLAEFDTDYLPSKRPERNYEAEPWNRLNRALDALKSTSSEPIPVPKPNEESTNPTPHDRYYYSVDWQVELKDRGYYSSIFS